MNTLLTIHLLIFINTLHPTIRSEKALMISTELVQHCVDPFLAAAVMFTESSFRRNVIRKNTNGTQDIGLFQINTVHGYELDYIKNPRNNIKEGCKLINKHVQSKDVRNVGKFHSKTPNLKHKYFDKVLKNYLTGNL